MSRPNNCRHLTYPACGCVPPPVLAHHLILEKERKEKAEREAQENAPKKRGRKPTPWAVTPKKDEASEFLEALPEAIEDPYTRANLLRMVTAQLCIKDFAEFVRQAWHVVEPTTTLEWNWHHELICKILQGIYEDWEHAQDDPKYKQRVRNCVMNVPPGSLKSRLVVVMFPVWVWLRRPGTKFICLSVNEDAAFRDARDAKALINSEWMQQMFAPDWALKDDQNAIGNYGNTRGGVRISKASGAEIVGQRGDFLLVDDANNPKEAESKIIRESVNDTYNTNIHNRTNHPEKSVRIGIQQRTHAEDWTGYVTSKDGIWTPEDPNPNRWLHVIIPAEFEPERKCVTPWGSDIRTVKGESLHPVRMSKEWLDTERQRFGSYKYAGQMQQRPVAAEGGLVKMSFWRFFHYEGQLPIAPGDRKGEEIDKRHPSREVKKIVGFQSHWDFDWKVISLDPAAKKTERGSQHGILVIAGKGPQRFILDDRTMRGDVLEVLAVMERLCRIYDPDRILIEAKAAGPALMTMFEDRFQSGKILGSNGRPLAVVVEPIEPQGDKGQRLDACLSELESGLVHLHDGASWLDAFIGEVCSFPQGSYDDRPDSLSQALNHMRMWGSYQLPKW